MFSAAIQARCASSGAACEGFNIRSVGIEASTRTDVVLLSRRAASAPADASQCPIISPVLAGQHGSSRAARISRRRRAATLHCDYTCRSYIPTEQ
jgi:hypothetical protein